MHATAAMQGVYSRENTSRDAAESGVSTASSSAVLPKRRTREETTLSLAMKPVSSAVQMRQSPKPRGLKSGESQPAVSASRLSLESATTLRRRSNVCRNQMTIVAAKMTVKARWRKSLDFSHRSWQTFFAPGMR